MTYNILIFSPTPSHPQDAGNRTRIYNLASSLQSFGHIIHFVYFTQEGIIPEQEKQMCDKWDTFTLIKKEKIYKRSTPTHYLIDDWYQDNIGRIIQEKCRLFHIDIIFTNYIFQSKILEYVPKNVVKILDTLDRFSDRHIMQEKHGITPDYFYTIQEEESKALNRSDYIIAIQESEATFFQTLTHKPVKVIEHIETKHYLNKQYGTLQHIGFIGSGNSANKKSIEDFIDIFLLKNVDKSLILHIAGSICNSTNYEDEAIVYHGFVDDLEQFYQKMDIIINPLIFGTGLKIKSIEALSYGVPIVSTVIGFEGIQSKHIMHQFSNNSELVNYLIQIKNDGNILTLLAKYSVEIFNLYNRNVTQKLNNLMIEIKEDISPASMSCIFDKELLNTIKARKKEIDFSQKINIIQEKKENYDSKENKEHIMPNIQNNTFKAQNYYYKYFLNFEGDDFIRTAYNTILLREPDEAGMRHFKELLQQKRFSKIEIIKIIQSSKEGKQYNISIKGLSSRYLILKLSHIPVIGYIINFFIAFFTLPKLLVNTIYRDEEIGTLHGQIRTMRYKYKIIEKKIFQLEHKTVALETEITTLHDKVSEINTLSAKINTLHDKVSEINTLKKALSNINKEIYGDQ